MAVTRISLRGDRRTANLALVGILLLALALRLYRLDHQSLWNDEGTTVALAHRSLAAITRDASRDIHPPLYYYLLHFWVRAWGDSEFAVRSLSALMGVGVVGITFILASRLFSHRVGLLSALLVSVAPFHVYYSQEARMYMAVTLFSALATLALVWLLERWSTHEPRKAVLPAVAYLLCAVAAVYSHYLAFSLILAHNVMVLLWLLWRIHEGQSGFSTWRKPIVCWLLLQALLVGSYVPWLVISSDSLRSWPAVSAGISPVAFIRLVLQAYALGVTFADGPMSRIVAVVMALPALAGLFWALGRSHGDAEARHHRAGTVLTALYAAIPPLVVFFLSLNRPMYKPKFVLLATPGYHILQAVGIVALSTLAERLARRRWLGMVAGGAVALCVLGGMGRSLCDLYFNPAYWRDDYRGIVEYIEATSGPGDAILINAPGQIETVDYYYEGPLPMYPLPRQRPIDIGATRRDLEDMAAKHERIYAILWATDESDPDRFVEGWLGQYTFKAMDSWFGNVRLAVYAVPESLPTHIASPTAYSFGDVARLVGYTLATEQVLSGDVLQLTLYWEALHATEQPFKVFTHLVDGRGAIVGQQDSEPAAGSRPTTAWEPGEVIADHHGIMVFPATPPGEVTLRVGMYGAYDGVRLSIAAQGRALGDALDLTTIRILAPATPPPLEALDIEHHHTAHWPGVTLVGHSLISPGGGSQADANLFAGQPNTLVLFWRREGGPFPSEWEVRLGDRRGRAVWQQRFVLGGGSLEADTWRQGEIIRDVQILHPSPDLPAGTYTLSLRPIGLAEDQAYVLQRVTLYP